MAELSRQLAKKQITDSRAYVDKDESVSQLLAPDLRGSDRF